MHGTIADTSQKRSHAGVGRVPAWRSLFGWFVVAAGLLAAGTDGFAQTSQPMCVIDMGSNTFRRIVASFVEGRYDERQIEKKTVGVGDDLARHGRISDGKLAEIKTVLSSFKASCKKEGAAPIAAVGTAAFREAPNGVDVVRLAKALGVPMEIATERRESELAYLVGALGRDGYAVIDNGSRSIELVAQVDGKQSHAVLDLGYRPAYETFFAKATDAEPAVRAFRERLRRDASRATFMRGKSALVGVEFGEMVEVLFEGGAVEGRGLTLAVLTERLRRITNAPAKEFQALKRIKDVDRALPRLVVAVVLMEEFGYTEMQLTSRELGAGVIIEAGRTPRR